jgi:hypothetical protein
MMKKFTMVILLLAIEANVTSVAADDFDDLFADDPFATVVIEDQVARTGPLTISQAFGLQSIVNINSNKTSTIEQAYSGLSSLQLSYRPGLQYRPNDWLSVDFEAFVATDGVFAIRSEQAWSEEDRDNREFVGKLTEFTVDTRYDNWFLTSGLQTVTLGLADALSISNRLYAQDLGVPGLVSLEDAAIPAWTSLLSGNFGPIRVKTGVIFNHETNTIAEPGTDFANDFSSIDVQTKNFSFENMSSFVSLSGVLGALDWQTNINSQLEHSPYMELGIVQSGTPPVFGPVNIDFARTEAVTAAVSYVVGSTLFKAEAGVTLGFIGQRQVANVPSDMIEFDRASGVLGLDYNSNRLGRLVAEIQVSRVLDYENLDLINTEETTAQWVLMLSKNFFREQLNMSAQIISFDISGDAGRIQGLNLSYDISDTLSTEVRYLDYVAGEFILLNGADDRDRLVVSVELLF